MRKVLTAVFIVATLLALSPASAVAVVSGVVNDPEGDVWSAYPSLDDFSRLTDVRSLSISYDKDLGTLKGEVTFWDTGPATHPVINDSQLSLFANVGTFRNGHCDTGVAGSLLVRFDSPSDASILEPAPPEARVVGGGTLAGTFSPDSTFSSWRFAFGDPVLIRRGYTCVRDISTVHVGGATDAAAEFCLGACPAVGNLVGNASFEANTSGWGSFGGTLSRVAVSGAPDGAWVARARRASGTSYSVSDNIGASPTVAQVTPGSTYVASCQVRAAVAQANGRPVRIVLRERVGSTGMVVKETIATSTLASTFRRLAVAAVALSMSNSMGLRCEQTSAVAGDAFDADLMTLALASPVAGNINVGPVWTAGSVNTKRASMVTLSAPRDVVSLHAYLDGRGATTGSQPVRGVLYAGTASGPSSRIATTSPATIAAGRGAGWVKLSFATPVRLAAGTYWLGMHTGGPTAVMRYAAGSVQGALRYNADSYADGAAASFGTASTDDKSLSLYATGASTP